MSLNDHDRKYYQDQIEISNKKAKKALEDVERLEGRVKKHDRLFSLSLSLGLILGIGGFFITTFIDQIRARPYELGWLQMLGMATFFMVGVYSGVFLRIMKEG